MMVAFMCLQRTSFESCSVQEMFVNLPNAAEFMNIESVNVQVLIPNLNE